MDELLSGLEDVHSFSLGEPLLPWVRPYVKSDVRLNPGTGVGAGRRLVHPFLPDLVYPELPSRIVNFDYDVLRKTRSVATRTLQGTGISKYLEERDDVQVSEVWDGGGGLSIPISFFRLLYRYMTEVMPPGNFVGWIAPDLTPHGFFVELLDLKLGSSDAYSVIEFGSEEPFLLLEPLTLTWKTIRTARFPVGVVSFSGH